MWFLGVQDFGLESCEAWDFRCQRFCSRFSNYAAWFRAVFDNDAQRLEASSRSDTNGKWQQHSLQTPRRKLATWRTQLGDDECPKHYCPDCAKAFAKLFTSLMPPASYPAPVSPIQNQTCLDLQPS